MKDEQFRMNEKGEVFMILYKLFVAVCPEFGKKFAFNAKDLNQAQTKIDKWNSYHSFTGQDKWRVEEAESLDGLNVSLHNEYVEDL